MNEPQLGIDPKISQKIFSPLVQRTKYRRALKVFAKRYIMLKNQSLQNGLKLVPLNQINPPDCQNIKFDQIKQNVGILCNNQSEIYALDFKGSIISKPGY